MSSLDSQQQRLLHSLREAHGRPVAFSDLHAAGISHPATIVSELEAKGYAFEHVRQPTGVRLLDEPSDPPLTRWRRRPRR